MSLVENLLMISFRLNLSSFEIQEIKQGLSELDNIQYTFQSQSLHIYRNSSYYNNKVIPEED